MWQKYFNVTTIEEALEILHQNKNHTKIIAGGTDLMLEMENGGRPEVTQLVDFSRVKGLDKIEMDAQGTVHIGPLVTHNHVLASAIIREHAYPLLQACWHVGSPQIRNRGTVAGNLITASPANDTISPLVALGAWVVLRSTHGERKVALSDFYTGVRRTVMEADEMLVDIAFPKMTCQQKGIYKKFALRRAQAISLVNLAIILDFQEERIAKAAVTLGAVAPTIIHAGSAEAFLVGKALDDEVIGAAAGLAEQDARPIDDVRGSARYRAHMVGVLTRRGLESLKNDYNAEDRVPENLPLLWGKNDSQGEKVKAAMIDDQTRIHATINGKPYEFSTGQQKTLLHLVREEAGLVGTKEGCSEGECGACTLFLDGKAVMSCLVPAARADGAEIVTIEGLSPDGRATAVQQAFIEKHAVQCGYCTPGFVMSATKLLEEMPKPSVEQIKQAITGNLCRCTGYYKIVRAIEKASK